MDLMVKVWALTSIVILPVGDKQRVTVEPPLNREIYEL